MLLAFLLIPLVSCTEWWEGSVTVDITDGNFREYIGLSRHIVIEFYAPFCHWCRMMFHEYEELSKHYNSKDSPWKREDVLIARVNAQYNPHISSAIYEIWAYPQLIFIPAYSDIKKSTFDGPRIKFKFIEWIEGQVAIINQEKLERENQEKLERENQEKRERDNQEKRERENQEKNVK